MTNQIFVAREQESERLQDFLNRRALVRQTQVCFITGVTGLTEAQKATLKALGAMEMQ